MILSNFFDKLIWLLNSLIRAVILGFLISLSLTMMRCGPDQLTLEGLKKFGREKKGIYTISRYNRRMNQEDRYGITYLYLENPQENIMEIGLRYIQKSHKLISAVQIQKSLEGFSTPRDPDYQDWTTIFNNRILFLRVKNDSIIEVRTNVKEKGEELKINKERKDKEKIVYYKYELNSLGKYNFELNKSFKE